MCNDESNSAGKRVLEKEFERHRTKLNGPKNTAKHFEAKQNWINREREAGGDEREPQSPEGKP